MLPFMKSKEKSIAGLIIKHRQPDEGPAEPEKDNSVEPCMRDFLAAVERKDPKGMSDALIDAHDIMHQRMDEAEKSSNPHTYEAQNEKASNESEE